MKIETLYIEITNQCNLNCRSCYNRSGLNKQRTELSVRQLEDIITIFYPYGLKRFLLSGGEPALHTEFCKILDFVDKYPKITFGIVTNGTIHDPKLIDYLNTRNNLTLQLSLDGSCEDVNSKTRGPRNFEKVLSFATQIHKSNPRPLLKMVVSQRNLADVEAFCQLALSIGFTPEISFLNRSGNGIKNWEQQKLSSRQKLLILKYIDTINHEQNANVFLPLCTNTCPLTEPHHAFSLYIKPDGSIYPCQFLYDKIYSLGNALLFDECSFYQKLAKISHIAAKRSRQDFGCTKCFLNDTCGRGCMAEAINLYGDPLANDNNCEYRKLQCLRCLYPVHK